MIKLYPDRINPDWPKQKVRKHMGPGPHPSGSPQTVHAGEITRPDLKVFNGERFVPVEEAIPGRKYTPQEMHVMTLWQSKAYWQKMRDVAKSSKERDVPLVSEIIKTPPDERSYEVQQQLERSMIWNYMEDLDRAIAARTTSEPIVLFRGRSFDGSSGTPQVGDTWENPNYIAAARTEDSAYRYANDRAAAWANVGEDDRLTMEIRVPAGYHVGVAQLGVNTSFEEFILPRNSKFRVVKVEERHWTSDPHTHVVLDLIDQFQVRKLLSPFSPYAKHMGPGPHPSGSPQTAHAGGRTHAYVETRPDADLPQKFAPFGHDTEYALERIKAMPIFEGWDAQLIEDEGITDIILTKEIVGQGFRYIRFSHSEWLELEMQGGYPADTLLMQAKAIEMFVNNPKARQLWDRLPVNVAFQSHEDMWGRLNAVGVYLDKGRVAPNATIQVAYEFEGDMRSEQDMFETLIHEYGHALDYQYSYRPKVGWAEWTAPPKMSEDFAKVLPLRDPWHQVVHFVHNWWGEKRRPGDHLSQRLMDAWAYPGSKRSHTEFFAEAVQYWVTEPRILSDTARAYNRFYGKSGKDTVYFDGEKEYPVYSGPVDASVLTDYIELALSAQPVVKRFVTEVPSPPPLDPSPYIEGMSRREWEQRVGSIAKHYGPGPHPGTGTPQSEHASDRQPQLSNELFGSKPPTPTTRLSFTVQRESGGMEVPTKAQERLDSFASRNDNVEWIEEDRMLVRHAVEDFERYLPGALPDDLEFRIGRDEPGTMAWVLADQPSIVWVNERTFLSGFTAFQFSRVDPPNLVAHEVYWDTVKKLGAGAETHEAIQAVKQAAIFHELVHVAASSRNIGIFGQLGHRWPAKLPYYGPEWFQEQLRVGDPRLPSNYAVDTKAEFLAEALTEYWYQGDDASEISKLTYDAFRQIIEES